MCFFWFFFFFFFTCIPKAALKLQSIWRAKSPSPDSAEPYLLTQKKKQGRKMNMRMRNPHRGAENWEQGQWQNHGPAAAVLPGILMGLFFVFVFFAWAPWGNAEAVHSGVSPCFRESGCSYKRMLDEQIGGYLCVDIDSCKRTAY